MTWRLAAVPGGLILAGSLFLPWYRAGGWFAYEGQPRVVPTYSAWEAFAALDVVLLALALAAFAAPRAAGAVATVTVAGLVSTGAHGAGAWIALAASVAILVAAGRPEWHRARAPHLVAMAGAALLVGSLFAPWYGYDPPPPRPAPGGGILGLLNTVVGSDTASAWQAFELIPVGLTIAAALAFAPRRPAAAAGPLAIALVLYALLAPPENWSDIRVGAWLGLAGAVLLLAGTLRT